MVKERAENLASTGNLELQLIEAFEELDVRLEDRQGVLDFLGPLRQKSPEHYAHAIRVGLLAKRIARFTHHDEKALLFAGTLHDVGKCQTPLDTLTKTEGWTENDTEEIKGHVMDGYNMIRGKFDFSAEIILLHHWYQERGYPTELPPFLHDYSHGTQVSIHEYARILALADFYDALHRENDRFGEKRALTGTEIKELMLKLNPDRRKLIDELYRAQILVESDEVSIAELQEQRYEEVWESEPVTRQSRETGRQVMLAAAIEPIPDKIGATTRSHDSSRHLKLEYFITAAVNIGPAFEDLARAIEDNDGNQPNVIYNHALKAQKDSVKNRAGGRINQGIIELLVPLVASQHIFNNDGSLTVEQVLDAAGEVLRNTSPEDVENLRKMKRFAYDLSMYTDRNIPIHPDAQNVFQYYQEDLDTSTNETSKAHNSEFVNGFPTVKLFYDSIASGEPNSRLTPKLESAYRKAIVMHGQDVGRGFLSDCCATGLYLYLSQHPKARTII